VIAIVDYGMGNLRSVEKAFAFLEHDTVVSDDPASIEEASGIVLPGVGSFGDAMRELEDRALLEPIRECLRREKPLLGVCLGYQLMFDYSQESPGIKGLGIFSGGAERFPESVKIPHMGWNNVRIKARHPILDGIEDGSFYYFVHSYYVRPDESDITLTTTNYGNEFVSGVARDNLVAFQFHPEKSSSAGLRLLHNFASMCVQRR
jgi:glutamine amidotransferase